MQAVSGKITGMWKAISTSRVSQFFNDLEHRARQSDVAVAILLIVFSVNLSGITGIVLMETDEKPDYQEWSRMRSISIDNNSTGYFRKGSSSSGTLREWERKSLKTKNIYSVNANVR